MPSTSRPLLLQVFQIKWSSPIPDPLSEAQSVIYRRMDSHLEPSWAEEFSFGGVSLTKEEESVRVGSQKQKTGTKRRQSDGYVGEDNRRPRKASKTTCSLFAKKKLGSRRNLTPRAICKPYLPSRAVPRGAKFARHMGYETYMTPFEEFDFEEIEVSNDDHVRKHRNKHRNKEGHTGKKYMQRRFGTRKVQRDVPGPMIESSASSERNPNARSSTSGVGPSFVETIDLTADADDTRESGHESGNVQSLGERVSNENANHDSLTRTLWKTWIISLTRRKPGIFASQEARLMIIRKATRGVAVYDGIGVTTANCLGLRSTLDYFCRTESWVSEASKKKKIKTLTTAVSQYLRWCVASCSCNKFDVWKSECLFENITKLILVEQFMGYFHLCCGRKTVSEKADALHLVCRAAYPWISRSQKVEADKVMLILSSY
ncbi:hypothetical protein FGB62_195g07 [Gracilaria domingensis]|nr:hypothetical protein FGB62_195g07 [Gracilaria domingensis]